MSKKGGGHKPAHQNTFAYKHNPKSKKTAKIMAITPRCLCSHCLDVIEWKKKYRKYKPLSAPRRCQDCNQKTVTQAYHFICDSCAKKAKICAKCRQSFLPTQKKEETIEELSEAEISLMSERERRTYLRNLEKQKNGLKSQKAGPIVERNEEEEEGGEEGQKSQIKSKEEQKEEEEEERDEEEEEQEEEQNEKQEETQKQDESKEGLENIEK